ncbi:hypothetical protein MNEG_0854 [Monoraphidium neglectum]|uniref:Fibrous sheath-interacting protein 1 n=1 Tax=Monoraphidium neglectum TaxID=145388 RepID=A0A0D2LL55_9CHLO|nr:hypothetical protein MNEG_0854 [Monoraphidium neglectum]KIZ07099.1 hypothetical protein MNEG_0854 [Monoraphidium neglectum]|eukprot:XP_013906118.1 hypothetical protein MNEG_0854 [Monoraphidium neglectum]
MVPRGALERTASLLRLISSIYGPVEDEEPALGRDADMDASAGEAESACRVGGEPSAGGDDTGDGTDAAQLRARSRSDGGSFAGKGSVCGLAPAGGSLLSSAEELGIAGAVRSESSGLEEEESEQAQCPSSNEAPEGGDSAEAAAQPAAEPLGGGGDDGSDGDADEYELEAARARVALAAIAARLQGRAALEAELSGLMTDLRMRAVSEDGRGSNEEGVPGGAGGAAARREMVRQMVEAARQMMAERRGEYRALDGWGGPRGYDQLPFSFLPPDHPDPRVSEGLERIRRLDEKLRDATLAALVAAHEASPGAAADEARRRLEGRAARLDALLAAQRKKRLHAARLSRALTSLDGSSQAGGAPGERPNSYYILGPDEEQLLRDVMARDDDTLDSTNPFDLAAAPAAARTEGLPPAPGLSKRAEGLRALLAECVAQQVAAGQRAAPSSAGSLSGGRGGSISGGRGGSSSGGDGGGGGGGGAAEGPGGVASRAGSSVRV